MLQDLRFALRMIRSHPWFSAAIVTTLAFGIGVNTTVFTLVNAVLFKPLPFKNGDRIVAIRAANEGTGANTMGVSYLDYLDIQEQAKSFEWLEGQAGGGIPLSERGNPPEQYTMARVTPGFFDMIGVQPLLGRGLTRQDWEADAPPVLVIGYATWQARYGGDRSVIGRQVRAGQEQATIVGVMPEKFGFPNTQEVWMPLKPTPETAKRDVRSMILTGVRKPGVSMSEAAADMSVIAKRLAAAYPATHKDVGLQVITYHQLQNGGPIRTVFILMLGAVGFVLLIACANVANMMLSRALGRSREISIRAAMGASRWRLLRQLLVESTLLAFIGGGLGLLMARYGVMAFDKAVENVGKPSWILFTPDYMVFVYFAALCLLSGLLFGLAPALRASRVDLHDSLKEGSRGSEGKRGGFLSGALVVFQFSLAVILLVGAGLFIRGFLAQKQFSEALPQNQVMTAGVGLPVDRYPDDAARLRFYDQLLAGLQSAPGVRQAALVSNVPASGGLKLAYQIEGQGEVEQSQRPQATVIGASPQYFSVIDLPLLAGRTFTDRDGTTGNEVAIVTSDFGRRNWPNQSPLGKRFRAYRAQPAQGEPGSTSETPGPWLTVVGVSGDLLQEADEQNPDPVYFVPYRPRAFTFMTAMLRTPSDPASLTGVLRAEVQRLDPDLAISNVLTLDQRMENQGWYLRVFGSLFSVFAMIALAMAAVGIYAVIAQATGRRTREIGVRMALGATSGSILGLVLSRGVKQLAAGLVLGLAAAFGVTRFMGTLLYQVSPTDPLVFITVPVVLASVGLLACWLPARRAANLHPVRALREE